MKIIYIYLIIPNTLCISIVYIQGVRHKFYILTFCHFLGLVGDIEAHYTSFESLDPSSFIFVMKETIDDWNPSDSWERMTCIMMIHASQQNKEIMVAA